MFLIIRPLNQIIERRAPRSLHAPAFVVRTQFHDIVEWQKRPKQMEQNIAVKASPFFFNILEPVTTLPIPILQQQLQFSLQCDLSSLLQREMETLSCVSPHCSTFQLLILTWMFRAVTLLALNLLIARWMASQIGCCWDQSEWGWDSQGRTMRTQIWIFNETMSGVHFCLRVKFEWYDRSSSVKHVLFWNWNQLPTHDLTHGSKFLLKLKIAFFDFSSA